MILFIVVCLVLFNVASHFINHQAAAVTTVQSVDEGGDEDAEIPYYDSMDIESEEPYCRKAPGLILDKRFVFDSGQEAIRVGQDLRIYLRGDTVNIFAWYSCLPGVQDGDGSGGSGDDGNATAPRPLWRCTARYCQGNNVVSTLTVWSVRYCAGCLLQDSCTVTEELMKFFHLTHKRYNDLNHHALSFKLEGVILLCTCNRERTRLYTKPYWVCRGPYNEYLVREPVLTMYHIKSRVKKEQKKFARAIVVSEKGTLVTIYVIIASVGFVGIMSLVVVCLVKEGVILS